MKIYKFCTKHQNEKIAYLEQEFIKLTGFSYLENAKVENMNDRLKETNNYDPNKSTNQNMIDVFSKRSVEIKKEIKDIISSSRFRFGIY